MTEKSPKSDTCPNCGKSWRKIRYENRVGCAYCFTWFDQEIGELFQRPTGAYVGPHSGQVQDQESRRKSIIVLKKKLEDAVAREEFEKAKTFQEELNILQSMDDAGGEE
jgi:protein arginine kinase activator